MRSLIPWRRGSGSFEVMRREMDDWMRHFFGGPLAETEAAPVWAPRVDVEETDQEILVKADLPGVDPKDVEVTVADDVLVLRGEKKEKKEEKGKNFHRVERFTGSFYREVPLPVGAETEKISATSAKGVITVTIPKKPGETAKKIAVKSLE